MYFKVLHACLAAYMNILRWNLCTTCINSHSTVNDDATLCRQSELSEDKRWTTSCENFCRIYCSLAKFA